MILIIWLFVGGIIGWPVGLMMKTGRPQGIFLNLAGAANFAWERAANALPSGSAGA